MSLVFSGSATIDEMLMVRKADENFFHFAGQDIYVPITQRIHEDDIHRLSEALNHLRSRQMEKNIISVRVRTSGDNFCWTIVELSLEPFDLDGKPLFHLVLFSMDDADLMHENLLKDNQKLRTLLSLTGSLFLSYSSVSNTLEIYTSAGGQRLYLVQGNLDILEERLKDRKSDTSLKEIMLLCHDIRCGRRFFQYVIKTDLFSPSRVEGYYTFHCQSLPASDGTHETIGCISAYQKDTSQLVDVDRTLDPATAIFNKKTITERAQNLIASGCSRLYLAVLDLDDFKAINDTYGHLFGDEVLMRLADIIRRTLGENGIVGRIGGDEMMLLITGIHKIPELRNLLRAIRTNVEWAYKKETREVRTTCSIGIAAYPDNATSYETLFELADRMLYIAKKKGKNRYIIYTPEIHDRPTVPEDVGASFDVLLHLRENKAGVMQHLLEDFLIRKILTYEAEFRELLYGLDLDKILMVCRDMTEATLYTRKEPPLNLTDPVLLDPEPEFIHAFDENHTFFTNNLFYLKATAPALTRLLKEHQMDSIFFYQICCRSQMTGYLLFARYNRRQLWSEQEKIMLTTVGKAVELSMQDR